MNFKHKKSLGQNFLKDDNVLNKIINSFKVNSNDLIIEIGPGQGALTKKLIKLGVKVLAFEVDVRLEEYLSKLKGNLEVVYKDILEINIDDYIKDYDNVYIVANLPYYITTPIISKFINYQKVKEMVLMVQNEVADRICANVKTSSYGYFTVLVQSYFEARKLFKVSKNSFLPVPKVDSAVIKLTRYNDSIVFNKSDYNNLLKNAFKMKRKNLKNNLYMYDLNKIDNILKKYNLSISNRAEEVPIMVFKEIITML